MAQKEIQTTLKQARAAIDNKDFKEAARLCKALLKEDSNNYNALVFYAVAADGLDHPDEAVAAYSKATEISPMQPLAWQGLCRVYERTAGSADQKRQKILAEVYRKLIVISDDPKKKLDYGIKLYNLTEQIGDLNEIVEAHKLCMATAPAPTNATTELWAKLAAFLTKVSPTEDQLETVLSAVKYCLSDHSPVLSNISSAVSLWSRHIEHFLKADKLELLEDACRSMALRMPSECLPHRVLGRVFVDFSCADLQCPLVTDVATVEGALLKLDPDGPVLSALRAVPLLREVGASTLKAHELLESASVGKPACHSSVRVLLARACCLLHRFDEASRSLALAGFTRHTSMLQSAHYPADVTPRCAAAIARQAALLHLECTAAAVATGAAGTAEPDAAAAAAATSKADPRAVLEELLSFFQQHYDEHWKALWIVGCCRLQQDDESGVLSACDRLTKLGYEAYAHGLNGALELHRGNLETAECRLLEATRLCNSEPVFYKWLGCTYAGMTPSREEAALTCLLKSARLDPFDSQTFVHLGHHYRRASQDKERALACYLKAHKLDPDSSEAGTLAVDTAFALKQEDVGVQVLLSVTSRSPAGSAKWAWLRLGLFKLKSGDHDAAVQSLQCALRADPRDSHCWECLADAYFNRGSYSAALKAFSKVHELNKASTYSLFKIAQIKEMLRENTEAIQLYQQILDVQPGYVPALKGIGDSHLALGKAAVAQFLDETAVGHCQNAIDCYYKALIIRPDLTCLWKLLGDACMLLHPLAEQTVTTKLFLPEGLLSVAAGSRLEPADEREHHVPAQSMAQVLTVGCRCYSKAVGIASGVAAAWHDLGVALLWLSRCKSKVKDAEAVATAETASYGLLSDTLAMLLRKAEHCLKKAISLDPGAASSPSWNALGLVQASPDIGDCAFAQHCFIKAIQLQSSNVVAWANLGTLYLLNNRHKLAHEAFSRAQSCNPEYPASWIGQARIAALVGQSEEAMDLMRHACGIGHHLESQTGYAHCVGSALKEMADGGDARKSSKALEHHQYSIVQMSAINVASDALDRYLRRSTDDPPALNTFGLLLERQGLLASAARAFKRALELAKRQRAGTRASEDDAMDFVVNYSRVLSRLGRHKEALDLCAQFAEDSWDFAFACHVALLRYSAGLLRDSCEAYKVAEIRAAGNDKDRSEVLAAMGVAAYRSGAFNDAMTFLYKGCLVSSPSAHCMAALCTIGLMERIDLQVQVALAELVKIPLTDRLASTAPSDRARADSDDGIRSSSNGDGKIVADMLGELLCYAHSLKGNPKAARNSLLKAIHRKPASASARCRLLRWWLQQRQQPGSPATAQPDADCESALHCAQVVATRGVRSANCLVPLVLTFLALGRPREAASVAKKAVHIDPSCAQKWLLVIAACHAQSQASTPAVAQWHSSCSAEDPAAVRLSRKAQECCSNLPSNQRNWLATIVAIILCSAYGDKWRAGMPSDTAQACASYVLQTYAAATQEVMLSKSMDAVGPLPLIDALDAFVTGDGASLDRLLSSAPAWPYAWLLRIRQLAAGDSGAAAAAACRLAISSPMPSGISSRPSESLFALNLAVLKLNSVDRSSNEAAAQPLLGTVEEFLAAARSAVPHAASLGIPALLLLQATATAKAATAVTTVGSTGPSGDTRRARSLVEKALLASNSRDCRFVLRRYILSLSGDTAAEAAKLQDLGRQAEVDHDEDFVKLCKGRADT